MANILLMEDCVVQALMLAEWLELDSHEVCLTHNAGDALNHLKPGAGIDLVITDIFGPEGSCDEDGLTLIETVRTHEDPAIRKIPIISISGVSFESAAAGRLYPAAKIGSDAHFVKPIRLGQLSDTVSELIEMRALAQQGAGE